MAKTSTSFKPGEVHNPNGRPPRDWTVKGLIEDALEEQDETGVPYKKAVTNKLRQLALKGDIQAIKEIHNRLDGMATQDVKLDATVNLIFDESLKQDE